MYSKVHSDTINVYERNAKAWDARRSNAFIEKPWIDKFTEHLPERSKILDVGCGSADPIARHLIEQGYSITGIDSSPGMISICKSKFPEQTWLVSDMRELNLNQKFAGLIAWDSFFHLNHTEQREVLPKFISLLAPGGALLLTIGHEHGEVPGKVEGEAVYHSSLAPEEYRKILSESGVQDVEITLQDGSCGNRTILLARAKTL